MFGDFSSEPHSHVQSPFGIKEAPVADFNHQTPKAFQKYHFLRPDSFLKFSEEPSQAPRQYTERDVYENNSGTSLAVAVGNKLIVAADTRHSAEYNINSRNMTRIFPVGPFFFSFTGFYADGFSIYISLLYNIKEYENNRKITLASAAHLLYRLLYSRRFFPYHVFSTLSGVEDGVPKIYNFDPIGSYDLVKCRCDGSSAQMVQPLLDSWISGKNFKNFEQLGFDEVLQLVKKAFDSSSELDIRTKDYLEIYVTDGTEVKHEYLELRKD